MKISLLIFTLISLSLPSIGQTAESVETNFTKNIKALQIGDLQLLELNTADSILSKSFLTDKIDDRDRSNNKSGYISIRKFKPLTASSILDITNNYVLLILEENSGKIRAATFSLSGVPIQCTLLYDNAYFSVYEFREHESRRYSPNKEYYFDFPKRSFVFSQVMKTTEIVKKGNDYFEVAQMYNDAPDETNNKWFVKVADNGEFSSYTVEQPTPNKLQFEHFTLTSSFCSENRGLNLITDDAQNNDQNGFRIYADIDASINLLDTFRFCQDEVIQFSLNESEKRGSIEVFQQHKNILGSEGPGDFCEVHNASFLSDWERVPVQFNVFTPLKYASHERTEFEELSMEKFQAIIKSECDDYHFSLVQNYEQLEQIKQHVILKEIILKIIFTDFTTGEKHEERIIYDIQFGC